MARTVVAYTNHSVNGSVADSATTNVALNPGTNNGHVINDAVPELTLLRITVGATGGNITVKAGDSPPALAAGQGDLVAAVANNATHWIGPLESGRFIQTNGSIEIDVAAAVVPGTICAFRVARK